MGARSEDMSIYTYTRIYVYIQDDKDKLRA